MENTVASNKDPHGKKRRHVDSNCEDKVELPTHMRNNFLHTTSHLPLKVFRHLESYITPSTTTSKPTTNLPKKVPGKKSHRSASNSSSSSSSTSSNKTAIMDLGPDLYVKAEELEAAQEHSHHDPQRESSSAAASRAKYQKQLSSSGSSSRYSAELAQSQADTEAEEDEADLIHADPVYKANPTTAVCKLHEFTYSSQWTRPATELLKEILEVRYPAEEDDQGGEERPLLRGRRRKSGGRERHSGWWRMVTAVFSRS